MAVFNCEFFSLSLVRNVPFMVVSPGDAPSFITDNNPHYTRPAKTVYLLNGHSGSFTDWMYNGRIWELSGKYNITFVLPSGENSFYLNESSSEHKFADYVGKELVEYTRKTFGLSQNREDTFIAGLSMGGFGAIHTGLAFPQNFSKIIGLSSALIIHTIKNMKPGTKDAIASYEYYEMVFGNLSELVDSENNPETLILKNKAAGVKNPLMYLAIGTDDFLYGENQLFKAFLEKEGVPFEYYESKGTHDWNFWLEYFEPSLKWLLELK